MVEDDRRQSEPKRPGPAPVGKKVYSTPQLIEYGSVAKLTANGTQTTNADATTMMMIGTCL